MSSVYSNGCVADTMVGDCITSLRTLPAGCANTCVTSPPYFGLRDYGHEGQIGLEETPDAYVARLVDVFREVRRVLRDDGTLWLNLGDSYARGRSGRADGGRMVDDPRSWKDSIPATNVERSVPVGLKEKDLIGIPWLVAFALRADGWYLRQDIIWAKATSGASREGNGMPESVRDRCAKSHEYLFLLAKSKNYYFDCDAIKEPAQNWGTRDRSKMRQGTTDPKLKHGGLTDCTHEKGNRRSVWRANTSNFQGAHFATFPPGLIEPCVIAGAPRGGLVIDPFGGSGTTGGVALKNGRSALLCELNPEYAALVPARIESICK